MHGALIVVASWLIGGVFIRQEKEDWINSIGRAIVRHSRSMADREVLDYS